MPTFIFIAWLIEQTHHTNTAHKTTNDLQSTNISTNFANCPNLSPPDKPFQSQANPISPQPIAWQPQHSPDDCIYTAGSLKRGQPRLGAAVIHSLTSTTSYIDASGLDETRTIMRAELAAIRAVLNTYKDEPCICILTCSQTSLHANQNELQRPSHTTYHHHKPFIAAIVTTL